MNSATIVRSIVTFIVGAACFTLFVGSPAASGASIYDPGPVSQVQGATGDGTLTVSWAPANPGTSSYGTSYSIVSYKVQANVPGVNSVVASCETQTTTCTLRNLVNGVDHFIQITATNNMYGTSNVWSQGPWRPCCSVPTAPASVAAAAGDTTASVSWTPPANAAKAVGPFNYRVVSEPAAVECNTSGLACEFQGLVNGTSYSFVVTASTSFGTSAGARSPSVLPKGLPGAPSGVVGYLGERGRVDVTWVGPASTGGVTVVEYVATASPGGANCISAGGISCTIEGLTNGQDYTFTVAARNEVGWGPASEPSAVARLIAGPGKPRTVKVSVVRGSANVAWQPPASTGGLVVSKYLVMASPGGRSCATTKTTCRVTGLADGVTFTFSVQAFNKKGPGLPASSTATRMPSAPAAPAPPEKPSQSLS